MKNSGSCYHIVIGCLLLVPALCDLRKPIASSSHLRHRAHLLAHDSLVDAFVEKPRGGAVEVEEEQDSGGEAQQVNQKEEAGEWKAESKGTKEIRREVLKYAPWLTREVRFFIYNLIFLVFILSFFGKLVWQFANLFLEYRKACQTGEHDASFTDQRTFGSYLQYRFAYWFEWTEGSRSVVLVIVTTSVLFSGAFLYKGFTGKSIIISTWSSFVWLVAPDAGALEPTIAGAFIGAIMSIMGLVIFALLLTLLQDGFTAYLESQGEAGIVESRHTVLIGLTDQTMPIIQQLCIAHRDSGTTIVVLSDQLTKEEMEAQILAADIEFFGSRVVVRTGRPWEANDLIQVAADAARTIVLVADQTKTTEERDAFSLQVLVTLRSQGWPSKGQIVVVCSLLLNKSLFERIGGESTEVIMLDRFSAKLLVQCSAVPGIARAVGDCLGFNGSELYIKGVPKHIQGLTLAEAALFYPDAVLLGYASTEAGKKTQTTFCPSKDYRLNADEDLVLIAENSQTACPTATPILSSLNAWIDHVKKPVDAAFDASQTAMEPPQKETTRASAGEEEAEEAAQQLTPSSRTFTPRTFTPRRLKHAVTAKGLRDPDDPETIIIIGWNEVMTFMMLELDVVATPGSKVCILAAKSKDEREEFLELSYKRNNQTLVNITQIEHIEGPTGSRFALDELEILLDATRIFILGDEEASSHAAQDMFTMATLLQIRDIYISKELQVTIPIIPEIMAQKTVSKFQAIRSLDFMNSSGLPSQILAMIAFEPRITHGLEEFLSENGHVQFQIEELSKYCVAGEGVPESINFLQAAALVSNLSTDVLLGWSLPEADTELALNQAAEGNKGEFHRMMADWCAAVHPQLKTYEWQLNPVNKCLARPWTAGHRVVVLSPTDNK